MKNLISMMLLCWGITSVAQTQTALPVYCDNKDKVAEIIQKEFKEEPVIAGLAGEDSKVLMTTWLNLNNRNWTITLTNGNTTCVVAGGINFIIKKIDNTPTTRS